MKDTRIYPEYVTCSWCGYKKYCKLEGHKWVCKACDTTNPQGSRTQMNLAYRPEVPTWDKYSRCEEMYSIRNPLRIEIQAKCVPGTLVYQIRPRYVTDFRSGPSIVNPLIPKIGDIKLALAWLIHDVNYHGFLSKKLADRLLLEMLEYAGMGAVKRNAVYYAVKFFAGSHYNTLEEDQGDIYNRNKTLVRLQWLDQNGMTLKRFNGRTITENAFR